MPKLIPRLSVVAPGEPTPLPKFFRVGAEVTLVSEPGIVMTVERSNPEFTECVWFDEMRAPAREKFLTATLVKLPPPPRRKPTSRSR